MIQDLNNQVAKDLRDSMEACVANRTNPADKKKCRKDKMQEFKNKIASDQNKDLSALKDSDVMDFIKKGARDAIMDKLVCATRPMRKIESVALLKEKKAMAKSLGKNVDDVKEYEFKRFAQKGGRVK